MALKDRGTITGAMKGGGVVDVSEVFSTYLYLANNAALTITNGINLTDDGGMVWIKSRSGIRSNIITDTERGLNKYLKSDTSDAEITGAATHDVIGFNTDGFDLGGNNIGANYPAEEYTSWTFKKQPRFFDMVTYTGNGVAGREIAHELGVEPGMIIIKTLNDAGNWRVYHNAIGNTQGMTLNSTGAVSTQPWWNNTTPTTTEVTLGSSSDVNQNTITYIAYLFAHDPLGASGDGSDGMIACGITNDGVPVELGWEPQYVLFKSSTNSGNWYIADTIRGLVSATDSPLLKADLSSAEITADVIDIHSAGFTVKNLGNNFIYMAIRRPMKTPLSSDEVFNAIARTGTGAVATVTGVGFAPDLYTVQKRIVTAQAIFEDRLRGVKQVIYPSATAAESTNTVSITAFGMDGFTLGGGSSANNTGDPYINYFFKRAKGFFDVVTYTSDGIAGRTVNHNLGVAPELIIVKTRNIPNDWVVGCSSYATWGYYQFLNQTAIAVDSGTGMWNNTAPTDSVFSLGTYGYSNNTGSNYIAYLFATLPGISKVGSYTGNGSSQTIDAGFSTGSKFIIIKRTDSTGDWFMWDSVRGIVAGDDPHLSLNTTSAEVTTDDSIDPDTSGFIVNQNATTNINVTSAEYIYYAIALPI